MGNIEINVNSQLSSSIFILKNGKPIIRIESLNCEGADRVIEQIKQALKLGGNDEEV
jgi:hypothetical protein